MSTPYGGERAQKTFTQLRPLTLEHVLDLFGVGLGLLLLGQQRLELAASVSELDTEQFSLQPRRMSVLTAIVRVMPFLTVWFHTREISHLQCIIVYICECVIYFQFIF